MFWLKVQEEAQVADQKIWTTDKGVDYAVTVVMGKLMRLEVHIQDKHVVHVTIQWNGRHPPDIGINAFRPRFVTGISPWGYSWDTTIHSGEAEVGPPVTLTFYQLFSVVFSLCTLVGTLGYTLIH